MYIKKMEITAAVKRTWGPNYDRVAAIQEYNRRKELPEAYPGEFLVQDAMTQAYCIVVEKK